MKNLKNDFPPIHSCETVVKMIFIAWNDLFLTANYGNGMRKIRN